MTYGTTDDLGYRVVENPVSVHDLHATMLHLCGIDHHRFTFKFQGLDAKLTGVDPCKVVKQILA
jgi:arylsulfatase A-like enzyme